MPRALDRIEEQLKEEKKTYFRIGRAIFIIEAKTKPLTKPNIYETPLGATLAAVGDPELKQNQQLQEKLRDLFLPKGHLKITVLGDPDAGLGERKDIIRITGYRFGLDDVVINGKTIRTTHGNKFETVRNLLDEVEKILIWNCEHFIPAEEGYYIEFDQKEINHIKRLINELREINEKLERRHELKC